MTRSLIRFGIYSALSFVLVSCTLIQPTAQPVKPITALPSGPDGLSWWRDSVFYEVFVRSFYDSNGDGIGDLNGLIQKLDYLNDGNPDTHTDLGVTALWLMPIHPATSYHGYDVIDYKAINPQYGTLDDFRRLLQECHKRGMRLIIDFVLNHTSSQHPWFLAAQQPSSSYRDWYIWSDAEPSGSGWHQSATGFYYGFFGPGMPDLNYANPAVTAEIEAIARFWIRDVGVDGFRLDAVRHLVEQGGVTANSAQTHAWLKGFRSFYTRLNPQTFTVGEVVDSSVVASRYAAGDELDLVFDFDLAKAFIASARLGDSGEVRRIFQRDWGLSARFPFATFITNHDQDRAMLVVGNEPGKAKVAASMLLTLPGVPFIYYGEEIGMRGKKPDELIRTPMQWSPQPQAGFTTGASWQPPNPDYPQVNVASQLDDPDSLLAHYRALIQARNAHVALRLGDYLPVESLDPHVLAFLRIAPSEVILVIINLAQQPSHQYELSLPASPLKGKYSLTPILVEQPPASLPWLLFHPRLTALTVDSHGGFTAYQPVAELSPYSTLILQFQPKR